MAYVEGPRYYRVTDQNQGAKVLVTAVILACNTVLSVLARAGIKFSTSRKWSWDDTTITIASILAIGHTGSEFAAYNSGMGQRMRLGGFNFTGLEKSWYAANVLYLASIIFAKLSVLLFIRRLTPSKKHSQICWVSALVMGIWGISTLFVWLFACGVPKPWGYNSDHCVDLGLFTRTTAVIDMVTDILLVALPVYLFAGLNYQHSGRWTIIAVFSMRALIVIPATFRILSIHRAFEIKGGDITWNAVPFEIWTVIALHYSVISASIPCVRPLLRSLESGLLDASMRKHPRLQREDDETDSKFMLMTLSGWSARQVMEKTNGRHGSISTDATMKKHLRRSIFSCYRSDSPETVRDNSVSSEADFTRRLHPEIAEHRTNIQATRTYPQFSNFARRPVEPGSQKSGRSTNSMSINVTTETSIRFEQAGKTLQEVRTRTSNIASNIEIGVAL